MPVWPFAPRDRLIESLEWRTDVIRAKGAEQRFALRAAPRRTFNFEHLLSEAEYTAARALVRQAETYQAPDWSLRVEVGAVASGSSVPIVITEDDLNLAAGDAVLLWQSTSRYEQCAVESVDSNGIILDTVTGTYTAARLLPLYSAEAPQGLQGSRPAGRFIGGAIAMELTESDDLADSHFATYRGHDLVDDCPIVAGQSFAEPILWPVDTIDNQVGVPVHIINRTIPDARYMMRWHVFTRPDLADLRRWLHSRRGRWKAFWLSSFGRDFELAEDIGAADDTVRVFAPAGVTDLGADSFDIEIYAGTSYNRQVTDINVGAAVDGRTTLVFTVDSVLGVAVTTTDIQRISYLRCLRFDADRVELEHFAAGGTAVAVPVLEVLP